VGRRHHLRAHTPGLVQIDDHRKHHSDRGRQYGRSGLSAPSDQLWYPGLDEPSGNCWDYAVVESFFATLKAELMRGRLYHTRQDARTEIFAYLEGFYNRIRRHSTLRYLSPVEFEQWTAQSTSGVH